MVEEDEHLLFSVIFCILCFVCVCVCVYLLLGYTLTTHLVAQP